MSRIIFDKFELCNNVKTIKDKINVDKLYYSLKGNSEPAILRELNLQGCFFEIASLNEYKKVIDAGANPNNIICGLPVKPMELLDALKNEKLEYLVFDCIEEFYKIRKYGGNSKKVMRIYVSDIDKESHPWGMKIDDLDKLYVTNKGFFDDIQGLSFHISRNYQLKKIQKVFDRIEYIMNKYFENRELILNIGGGLRAELPKHLALKYDLDLFYESVNARIEELKRKYSIVIYCEPGRGIVETACHIITDVELVKEVEKGANVFINLNIGLPVGSTPNKITVLKNGEEEEIYNIQDRNKGDSVVNTTFFDTVCNYDRFFTLPLKRKILFGEKIKLYGMGAYTSCRSNVFHSRDLLEIEEIE